MKIFCHILGTYYIYYLKHMTILLLSLFTVINTGRLIMLHVKYFRFKCILVFMISIVAVLDAIAESRLSKGISNLKRDKMVI